ncbi:hypothetical protein FACS1894166_11280 [Bacilli bacterium]|nr:hypothetical protein FACS1894166_11280 [Bacilli bacterium]
MKTKISDSTCVAQSKSHTHTHTQCDLNNSKSFTVQIDNNKPYIIKTDNLFIANENCLKFLDSIPDNSVDLIVTDPPFAINESKFDDKYYCRKSTKVVNGYVEAPKNISYEDWCYS